MPARTRRLGRPPPAPATPCPSRARSPRPPRRRAPRRSPRARGRGGRRSRGGRRGRDAGAADGDVHDPRRQVLPNVSVITTAPRRRAVRSGRAEPFRRGVRVLGQQRGTPPRRSRRRRRRSRTRSRGASRRSPGRRAGRPRRVSRSTHAAAAVLLGTTRPSALDTIFWVTATTSPSRSPSSRAVPQGARRDRRPVAPPGAPRREDLDAHAGGSPDHPSRPSANRAPPPSRRRS